MEYARGRVESWCGWEWSCEALEVWWWGSSACDTGRERLGEVDCFVYLGSQVAAGGGCVMDVVHRMNEGCGALKGVLISGLLGMGAGRCQCEGVIVPVALCGAEAWECGRC